jgi:hypothetical protein
MEYLDPVDTAANELPFYDPVCGWRPQTNATSFQEAFEAGRSYANGLVAFLKKHPDSAPNFLLRIVIDQGKTLPDDPLAPERGYIAGFWERVQVYLRQA